MAHHRGHVAKLVAIATTLAMIIAACSDGDDADIGAESEIAAVDPASELPDLEGRPITIGTENSYRPFSYVPQDESDLQGWDHDAWFEICRLLNCFPRFVGAPRVETFDQAIRGDIDVAAGGLPITEQRAETVAFSDPYLTVRQTFLVRVDDDRYETADDIINGDAIVATQAGTTNFELAFELLGGDQRIQPSEQFGPAVYALVAGEVDAVLMDDVAALGYIDKHLDEVVAIDADVEEAALGFVYPLDSDLIDPVNMALAEMQASGVLDEINEKFFGRDFAGATG